MLSRLPGLRRADGNGHLPSDAGLILETSELAARRLSPWEAVQLARDPRRPHTMELIARVFDSFQELHGDRGFRDDPAIVGGIAKLGGSSLVIVGHQKGASTEENIERNFGMPHPEGYRKAMRLYRLAEKFHLPLVTFIDTPGAFPGQEAEERGQAEAIARCIEVLATLNTPVVVIVVGEGGSGGAIALGVGDVVLALQNAIYSVISPEGAASILFRSNTEAERAAGVLKLSAPDLLELGIVDALIREPDGGAHLDHEAAAKHIKTALVPQLDRVVRVPIADLLAARYERFRTIGAFVEPGGMPMAPPAKPWWQRAIDRVVP